MHLSHLYEDLETWYEKSFPGYEQQVHAMQYPGITPPAPGTYALQPPGQSATQVAEGVKRYHSYGHSGSLSVVDSTASQITSNYGESYPAGTTIPVRGDFNTLDNPFHYTSNPTADHYSPNPAAGLHFLMFQPTIEIFNQRPAGDGRALPGRHSLSPRIRPTPASTRSCTRPTGRTTWSHHVAIAPFRSRNSLPDTTRALPLHSLIAKAAQKRRLDPVRRCPVESQASPTAPRPLRKPPRGSPSRIWSPRPVPIQWGHPYAFQPGGRDRHRTRLGRAGPLLLLPRAASQSMARGGKTSSAATRSLTEHSSGSGSAGSRAGSPEARVVRGNY